MASVTRKRWVRPKWKPSSPTSPSTATSPRYPKPGAQRPAVPRQRGPPAPLDDRITATRARKPKRLPVVLTRDEVRRVLAGGKGCGQPMPPCGILAVSRGKQEAARGVATRLNFGTPALG